MDSRVLFLGMTRTETFLMAGYLVTVIIFVVNAIGVMAVDAW
jgi:hypothetical protein